jgi:hypothetical protein
MNNEKDKSQVASLLLFSNSMFSFMLLILVLYLVIGSEPKIDLSDSLTGNAIVGSRARILSSTESVCIINLTQGYNIFSSACVSNASSLSEALAYIYQDYDVIYTYDELSKWKVYVPDAPSYVVQGINAIDDRKSYVVLMRQDQTLVIEGLKYTPRAVPYYEGFTLVGYPSFVENTSPHLFNPLSSSLITVYSINNSQNNNDPLNLVYHNYTVESGSGNLQIIFPGIGLWFYANESGVMDILW